MKLLFDENLSHKLAQLLEDIFPNFVHVRHVGLEAADDPLVWDYARNNAFVIVSKDADMHQRIISDESCFINNAAPRSVAHMIQRYPTPSVESGFPRGFTGRLVPWVLRN
jgi:hypothetical protein